MWKPGTPGAVAASLAAAAALTAAAGPAGGQPSAPEQQRFAQVYIAALRAQDMKQLAATIHPATLACITADNRAYFDAIFKSQLELGPRLGPSVTVRPPLPVTDGGAAAMPPEGFAFPVRPSYRMQINADRPDRSIAVQVYLAPGPGGWFAVHACPNATGLKYFAELSPQRKVDGAAVEKLDAGMSPQLRGEIGALLEQGHFIDAVHHLMAASGADASTASVVVQMQRHR